MDCQAIREGLLAVTRNHLPALLAKGRGEMVMDNSLRAAVRNNLVFRKTTIQLTINKNGHVKNIQDGHPPESKIGHHIYPSRNVIFSQLRNQ